MKARPPARGSILTRPLRAAVRAGSAQQDVVRLDAVAQAAPDPVERPLQAAVRERLDLAAVVAHQVVMVLAARQQRLVARSVGKLEPLDELQPDELVERAIDAGQPDPAVLRAQRVEDLVRAQAALLASKERDDELLARPARRPAPERVARA